MRPDTPNLISEPVKRPSIHRKDPCYFASMESIDTEVFLESGKCDRMGRRIRGAHEWSLILKRYDQRGLTQTAFCTREGLKYGTLVAWL